MWYSRNMRGYGGQDPQVCWPNDAKVAVQFVINYEEGGENCLLHGDQASEAFLSEIVGAQPFVGKRHWNMESIYEYGARAGFWRLHRLFTQASIPVTVYGVATALARSPDQVRAMQDADWEIASHGYRWIEYKDFTREEEAEHIKKGLELHQTVTGSAARGWYTGRCSMHTVDLVAELGRMSYISDCYADDLPYWQETTAGAQLMIPYTLDCNDMRFAAPQGFNAGDQFFNYLKDSFDALYAEGQAGSPKMLSIGLHCRLIGRPGRIRSLQRFIEYIQGFQDIWCPKRIDIAQHWHEYHPHLRAKINVAGLSQQEFIQRFGGVFEHSPWVAEQAFNQDYLPSAMGALSVHSVMVRAFRRASEQQRLDVLCAHPDLAGKLAQAQLLTDESTHEQASAGLNQLTAEEKQQFSSWNEQYVAQFGFPFIIAVKDYQKTEIIQAFQRRLGHNREQEFMTACREVERIAELRLFDLFDETPFLRSV